MTRNVRLGIAVVIAVIVCFTTVFNQMSANPVPGSRLLKVKPGELFTGDLKRIEFLFDQHTGCLEIEPPDGEFLLKVQQRIWFNGEERKHGESYQQSQVKKPTLLTFSFKGFEEEKDGTILRVGVALLADLGRSSRGRMVLPKIKKPEVKFFLSMSTSIAKLDGPLELKAGQPAMVFAFCEEDIVDGHPRRQQTKESIEDQVKRASRAVAFVVSWEEIKADEK